MSGYVDLFVYGTLKQGFANHRAFCARALRIRTATIAGSLYDLPVGYPAVQIPDCSILLKAGQDPARDAGRQHRFRGFAPPGLEATPEVVHGEWIRLPDPPRTLPRVDALEGVRPDGRGEYRRALVPAWTEDGPAALWVYWMPRLPPGARLLADGTWPARP
ncbi:MULTISPECIES: gamma-glutamylcyclotransferase [unclassified Thioalkalivibrio]|uniref:gamma-glutamylcyclotransferase family protein n=1 Tax=unclassified Thioalkalivibrio TaxID=2621013 RepID=UPI00036CBF64|nr:MULTISPECIES: gamma-glutamylcyclotransferase family protein [unclassified Thioalkalivibrio]